MIPAGGSKPIDFDAIDIAHQAVRLASELAVWPVWENGRRVYRLELRQAKRFYRVGHREYVFISLLGEKNTVAAACGLAASKLGNQALTADEAELVVIWLLEEGIASLAATTIHGAGVGHRSLQRCSAPGQVKSGGLLQKLNPFWIQIPVLKNTRRIESLLELASKCLHSWLIVIGILMIIVGCVVFGLNHQAIYDSTGNLFSVSGWISLMCTWVVLKLLHEAGHALACQRVGGQTQELGIVMILFAPLAYVDVSSCWRLSRRSSRMFVAAAGMFIELVVAAVAALAWLTTDDLALRFWLASVVLTAGVSTLLFNANPLMRFDGYYLLSDWVQIPNLAGEGALELKRIARWLMYGQADGGGHYRGLRRVFVICYGIAALVWRVFICLVLGMTAAVMFSGAGIALAVLGVVAWFGKPAWSFVMEASDVLDEHPARFARAATVLSVLVCLLIAVLTFPVSTGVHVHGVVRDPPESIVRSGCDGFVQQVHVFDGQSVRRGTPLVTLRNRELREELKQLALSLQECEIAHRIATDRHDASAEWLATQDRIAIEHQMKELEPRVSALTVRASDAGVVTARDLVTMSGRFVREGDEIARIIGSQPAEVIGLVHQDQIAIAKASLGQEVQIRDPSRQQFTGRLRVVDPRASHDVIDLSLAATHDGPLEVTRIEEDRDGFDRDEDVPALRFVDPHFIAHVDLSAQAQDQIRTGMRVAVRVGDREQSLGTRMVTRLWRFWRAAQDESRE